MKKHILLLFLFCSENKLVIKINSKLNTEYHNLKKGMTYFLNSRECKCSHIDSIAERTQITSDKFEAFEQIRKEIENSLINIKESDFIDFFKKRIQKEYIYYLFSLKKIP